MQRLEMKNIEGGENDEKTDSLFAVAIFYIDFTFPSFLYICISVPLSTFTVEDSILHYMTAMAISFTKATLAKAANGLLYNDVPQQVQDAFIAVEDKRFYSHVGFDPIRMVKAMQNNLFTDNVLARRFYDHTAVC